MPELGEMMSEAVERAGESRLNSTIALLVALAATFVALAGVKDRNLTLGMMKAQTKAVDTWNYYQAKSMKQNLAEATLDELHAVSPTSSAGDTQADKRFEDYRGKIARYEREKEDVKKEAEGYEHQYERSTSVTISSTFRRGDVRGHRVAGRHGADPETLAPRGGRGLSRPGLRLRRSGISRLEPSRGKTDVLAGIEQPSLLHSSPIPLGVSAIFVGGLNEESPVPHSLPGPRPRHGRNRAGSECQCDSS
jgi:hypothetical protein